MPQTSSLRRIKPTLTSDPAFDPPAAEPPATGLAYTMPALPVPQQPLQVGDYQVGEGYCSRLCGHPGIRY